MRIARWSVVLAASVLGVVGASGGQAPAEIAVPEGNGVPVITDGIFSPGEWDDAHRLALTPSVQLFVKQYRGVVFIGVRGSGQGESVPRTCSWRFPAGPSTSFTSRPSSARKSSRPPAMPRRSASASRPTGTPTSSGATWRRPSA